MKKLMFVIPSYEIGGASTVVRNLLDCLGMDRFDIVLVTQKLSSRHYPIKSYVRLIDLGICPQKGLFSKASNIMRNLILLRKHILSEAPDAILSFTAQANCYVLLSLIFRLKKGPKVIISEQSEEIFLRLKMKDIKYIITKAWYWILMFFLYPRATYVVPASKTIKGHMRKQLFLSPDKVRVIYNPVNIDRVKELYRENTPSVKGESQPLCIGTISRLSPEKGVHFLIEGFKILLEKMDATLIIIGDGPERKRLEKMTVDLGIRDNVSFTGWKDNPFKYMRDMDVFVLPSLWEGFSNVILEAMACGVPVIASDSKGGVREAIRDGENGLLIESESPSAISESIYYLLSNREKREEIIKEAHESVKQFDLGVIKKQYEDLILE